MIQRTNRILAASVLVVMVSAGLVPAEAPRDARPVKATAPASRDRTVEGFAQPFQEVTLGPVTAGRVGTLSVSEGQSVAKGTMLMSLDDAVQQARTLLAKLEAESNVNIELAKTRLRGAERELSRVRDLHKNNAASKKELEDAELLVEVRAIEVLQAEFEKQQAQQRYQLEKVKLAELRVHAPFDGVVTELLKRVGEQADEGEAVLTMVQLDPLKVVVDCPMELASKVRVGGLARIEPVDGQSPVRNGTVTVASRAGDAASQTFKVKLTVPNADGAWISGLKVRVTFEPDKAVTSSAEGSSSRRHAASDKTPMPTKPASETVCRSH